MKEIKKITVFSLLFIILASTFYNCLAFEIGEKELVSLGECEKLLRYKGEDKFVQYVVYKKDGKIYPAYCLNPEYIGIGTNGTKGYAVDGTTRLENEKVWKVIINGYPYKSLAELGVLTEGEAYTATKFAIYTIIENRNTADYSPIETEAAKRTYKAYLNIVNEARNSTEVLDNNNIVVTPKSSDWIVDEIQKDYVSKTYSVSTVVSNGQYKIDIEGNLPEGIKIVDINNNEKSDFKVSEEFKILIPISNLTMNNTFIVKANANLITKPVIYGRTTITGTQDYGIAGYMDEDVNLNFEEKYSANTTNIEILKKEYGSEIKLEGVKFNLLDSNKIVIKENLVTDESGKIKIENLIPGKYYIQEIQTLDGYNLYKDLIEVNIKLNEEVQVIVNNTRKSTTQITDVNEMIEITPKYTETVYNVDNYNKILNSNNTKKLPVTGY